MTAWKWNAAKFGVASNFLGSIRLSVKTGVKMGSFKSWLKSELPSQKYNAAFGGSFLSGYQLQYRSSAGFEKIPTKGLKATVQDGANVGTYVSAKRVVAGGVLFGPLGAGVGALIRKNHNEVHVVLERDDQIVGTISGSAKHTPKARAFANRLNASATDPDNSLVVEK